MEYYVIKRPYNWKIRTKNKINKFKTCSNSSGCLFSFKSI